MDMKLRLPLWAVIPRNAASKHASGAYDSRGQALAFSSTAKLISFMESRAAGQWKVTLVGDSDELVILVADLHCDGATGLCIDPSPGGSGGTDVPLASLLQQGTSRMTG
jgi:hypothetical protein